MTTATGSLEAELLALEREFWQALADGDVETARRLTDDTCVVAGPQGVATLDRDALAAMMQSATYTLHDFQISGAQVRQVGPDVAVVAYTVAERLTVDGAPITLDAADTSVWVRRGGRWVCALHTESLRGDPFGRDRA